MGDTLNQEQLSRGDELSLRTLFVKTGEYLLWFVRFWYVIILLALASGAHTYYETKKIKPIYPGETRLLIKPQDIAKESKSKILIYSRFSNSEKMVGDLILEYHPAGEDSVMIANTFLETYREYIPEGFPEDIPLDFQFENDRYELFSDGEKRAYKKIIDRITGKTTHYSGGYINMSVDEGLGIVTLATATPTEELTFLLLNRLQEKFGELVLESADYAERKSYTEFQTEADSLEKEYRAVYFELLKYKERYELFLDYMENTDAKMRRLQKLIARKEIEADILKSKYMVLLQHLKQAQNKMNIQAPIMKVLSAPLSPLDAHQPGAVKEGIKSAVLGAIGALFLLLLIKLFRDVMREG